MNEFPIAGDITSKIATSGASTGRLLLPDYTKINPVKLLPIEVELRTAFAAAFPDQKMWQPPAVSETMLQIAEFINSRYFVLLLLLKNMNKLDFSTILLQHIYITKKVFLDDPFPESPGDREKYVIWHILKNILPSSSSAPILFRDRQEQNDQQLKKAFENVNRQFNLKMPLAPVVKTEGGTGDASIKDAENIMAAANEGIKLMMDFFGRFISEYPSMIAYSETGVDGMISFFENHVIPKINEIIQQASQKPEIFPSKLDVAIREIVYRFDRQLKLDSLPGMQYEDIYTFTPDQRGYFVTAVSKYLIFLKMSSQPNFRTLQFDSANKDPTITVTLAIVHHFQNWKGGKNNKRFL